MSFFQDGSTDYLTVPGQTPDKYAINLMDIFSSDDETKGH